MTLGSDYFDRMYAADPDPWGFTDRWYEQRKRAVTLAALPDRRYGRAYEPGCATGVLTAELAGRCDELLATDVSAAALEQAAARVAGHPHVRVEQRALAQWPPGELDLVVLSELLYYLEDADLRETAARAAAAVAPGGVLLSVHWRHDVGDYPQSGDAAQEAVHEAAHGLTRTVLHVEADFALSVHVRPATGEDPARLSVAARAGLC